MRCDGGASRVSALNSDDLSEIRIEFRGVHIRNARTAMRSLGRLLDDQSALVRTGAIAELANRSSDPQWVESFENFLFHANEAGWLDSHQSLLVPCDWLPS